MNSTGNVDHLFFSSLFYLYQSARSDFDIVHIHTHIKNTIFKQLHLKSSVTYRRSSIQHLMPHRIYSQFRNLLKLTATYYTILSFIHVAPLKMNEKLRALLPILYLMTFYRTRLFYILAT
jgi:hypothetical protein